MNSRIPLLAGVAVAQLLLILAFTFSGGSSDDEAATWLELDVSSIDEISIDDRDNAATLEKVDGQWQIAQLNADTGKIDELLGKLADIGGTWPVATSADSAARFEVAEDNYQRKLVLKSQGDTVVEAFFGTSPGYQRVHARTLDSSEIYSVPLSNYEIPSDLDGWLDKALLATADTPARIAVRFTGQERLEVLERGDEGWLYNGNAANQEAAATYANRFGSLRILGAAADDEQAVLNELATVELTLDDDSVETLVLYRLGEDGDYLIAQEDAAQRFRLATYLAEQVLMTDVDFKPVAEGPAEGSESVLEEVSEE